MVLSGAWAVGTDSGTVISAGGDGGNASYATPTDTAGEAVVSFQFGAGSYVEPTNTTYRTVQAVYGWAILAGQAWNGSGVSSGAAGVMTPFTFTVYNRGNTSDTANLTTPGGLSHGSGASNWNVQIQTLGGGVITDTGSLGEDASFDFKVAVTPSSTPGEAPDGSVATFTVQIASTIGGSYTAYVGANAGYYGQSSAGTDDRKGGSITDSAFLSITGPTIGAAITVAGVTGLANGATEIGPGAEIQYQVAVSNTGTGPADNVVCHFDIPANTTLAYSGSGTDTGAASSNGMYSDVGSTKETYNGGWGAYSINSQGATAGITKVRFALSSQLGAATTANCFVRVDVQ